MTNEIILSATLIFFLRVVNFAVGTLRMIVITRDQKMLAGILAALEALIFAVVIAGVVQDLENIINLTAYCVGAGVGSWVGMALETRFVKSYLIVNVIASNSGASIAAALRAAGYGVTETESRGRDGLVTALRSVLDKREIKRFSALVHEINSDAFIVAEEARSVQRGWLGIGKGGKAIG